MREFRPLLCGFAVLVGSLASALAGESLTPRAAALKPVRAVVNPLVERTDIIYVKIQDDAGLGLRGGALADRGTGVGAVAQRLGGGDWERVHRVDEARLVRWRAQAERALRRQVADLAGEFHYHLPPGVDAAAAIDAFNALEIVEIALPVPLPLAAPTPPNYQPNQGYLNAATAGVGTPCLWQLPGGTGEHVALADLEYSWNLAHQDLKTPTLLGGSPSDPFNDDNHGTAVLGELAGLANGWGVTGSAYDGEFYVAAVNVGGIQNVAGAITTAMATLSAGDVILIEQQVAGPNYTGNPQGTQVGLVPVEWYWPYYNAIVAAVGNGMIVVEAAGNGSQDLDGGVYITGHAPFLPDNDSGAIIVGAGAAPVGSTTDRSRLGFSNYGSTVDLQGWGERVYSTGYGSRYSAEGRDRWYTSTFSGTSSASPIVAGAAMLLQSAYHAATGELLSPAEVKLHLQATASPQQSGAYPAWQNIGGRPNAAAALAHALPVLDANGNLTPDACEALPDAQACCLGGGCVETTPANCTAYAGLPLGAGSSCAESACSGQTLFTACTSGLDGGLTAPLCACADLDGDLDVDLVDFALIQRASGMVCR